MKKYVQTHFYLLLALAGFFSTPKAFTTILPGDWENAPQLGSAYFSNEHRTAAVKCVRGTPEPVGQAVGLLKYTNEADYEKIASAFSGSVSAHLDVPFVKAEGSLSYARENAATENRMNWFLEFHATPKSVSLGSDLSLSPDGRLAYQAKPGHVFEACGDEYISQIDYGAKLIGTLSIEFASREDRRTFEAAARVDVNWVIGRASASGDMNTVKQRMGSRTRIKVESHQIGGRPGELSAILRENVLECSLDKIEKCMETFAAVLRYANTNFREQLSDDRNFSVVRYHTRSYKDTAVFDLVPDGGFPLLNDMVKIKRQQIQ